MTTLPPDDLFPSIERWSLASLPPWKDRVKIPTTTITNLALIVRQDDWWAEWWWDMVHGTLHVRLSGECQQALAEMRNQLPALGGYREWADFALRREEERHEGLDIQPHRKGLTGPVRAKINTDQLETDGAISERLEIGTHYQPRIKGKKST